MKKIQVTYNYEKLIKRIEDKGFTQVTLAPKIHMSRTSLYQKLNSNTSFTQTEILNMARILDISDLDYKRYFFDVIVQKTELNETVSNIT